MIGYIWVYLHSINAFSEHSVVKACFIKSITNIPCPSCGTTRAVVAGIQGKMTEALLLNPLGFVVILIMFIAPVWIAYDVVTRKNSFYRFYLRLESFLKQKYIAIPLIILICLNWIWNITKEL